MSNIQLSALDNIKITCQNMSTKAFFKFTFRKGHVYFDIGWTWIWNQYFYLGIWNNDRTKIRVLPKFQLVTRINSQNRNETGFINVLWHIILYMNIGISNCHNWSFDNTNMNFLSYFSSIHDFWPPSTRNSLVHTSWGEMDRCEKRLFQLLKMRKS